MDVLFEKSLPLGERLQWLAGKAFTTAKLVAFSALFLAACYGVGYCLAMFADHAT